MEENQANMHEESPEEQTGPREGEASRSPQRGTTPREGPRHLFPMWQRPVCGTRIWITHGKRHLNTRKHLGAQYVLKEKFEML